MKEKEVKGLLKDDKIEESTVNFGQIQSIQPIKEEGSGYVDSNNKKDGMTSKKKNKKNE